MGCYDTFIDEEGDSVQCKAFNIRDLRTFHIGDIVPETHGTTVTVCLPDYEGKRFLVIKRGIFTRLTGRLSQTLPPYISKWGSSMTREQAKTGEMPNPYAKAIEAVKTTIADKETGVPSQ